MAKRVKRKRMNIMNINSKLPEDIVKVIFSKLPFLNLPNCRIVCKVWNDIIMDYAKSCSKLLHPPNAFIRISDFDDNRYRIRNPRCIHFDFDFDSDSTTHCVAKLCLEGDYIQQLSSCNGLVHIYQGTFELRRNTIWNPMTNEFFRLPKLERNSYWFGFGFSLETKQYKLFRVLSHDEENPMCTIHVWRFGITKRWKLLCSQPFSIHYHGTYLNGVIHWMGKNATHHEFVVYGLDVETETFETIVVLDVGPYGYDTIYAYFQPYNDTICLIVNMLEASIVRLKCGLGEPNIHGLKNL